MPFHSRKKSQILDVWLRVTSSSTPHYWKAYHIPKAPVRISTKAIFSSLCVMAEVCFDRTFLWACFGMMDVLRACFGTIGVLWLVFSGTGILTISFLPRLNLIRSCCCTQQFPT